MDTEFRKMRRHAQQLDDARVVAVLTKARRGVLSVIGDGGFPYAIPINFVFDPARGAHGSICFHCALEGHKLDAITRCDKVCFTAYEDDHRNEGEWWWYVSSVVCFCRARVIDDPQRKHDAMVALARKYFPPEVDIEADIAKNGSRVHMVELVIEHATGKLVQEK